MLQMMMMMMVMMLVMLVMVMLVMIEMVMVHSGSLQPRTTLDQGQRCSASSDHPRN